MKNCKICGSGKTRVTYKKDKWEVIECLECKHGITSPVPTQNELEKIYNGEYYEHRYTEKRSLSQIIRHERHRIKLLRRHHKKGDILDVGYGDGGFMIALTKSGYRPIGIDLSSTHSTMLKSCYGIDTFTDFDQIKRKFKVITLWHTLEHHLSPEDTIRRVRNLLTSDGILIVEVPNISSYDRYAEKGNWAGWELPLHINHFSLKSLQILFNKYNFKILNINHYHSNAKKKELSKKGLPKFLCRFISSFYPSTSLCMTMKMY